MDISLLKLTYILEGGHGTSFKLLLNDLPLVKGIMQHVHKYNAVLLEEGSHLDCTGLIMLRLSCSSCHEEERSRLIPVGDFVPHS